MNILLHLMILLPLLLGGQGSPLPGTDFKPVTFTVIDTAGRPVPGALVEASVPGPGNATGLTDQKGVVILQLVTGATLHLFVSRNSYYTTSGELWTGGIHKGPDGRLVPRVLPDSFTVTLKEVRDPVPLRKTVFRGRAPATGKPVGFDLEAGDWIRPYGRGTTTDLLFQFHAVELEPESFTGTMTLLFPNKGDGIQPFEAPRPFSTDFGSNLAPPHRAPVDGYRPSLSRTLAHKKGDPWSTQANHRRNYLLRTRTVLDPAGSIRRACYGWIQGEIEFDPRDPAGPQLAFTAFFNPDPHPDARSLEDPRFLPN
ncbi:MAG: Ig-like domain-containing protein [Oceanipulchritudo sp.]|jgi:hypothetical protein